VRTFALNNTFATGARQFLNLKLPLPLAQQTSLLAWLVIVAKLTTISKIRASLAVASSDRYCPGDLCQKDNY
jgi:hypothetical protein